MSSPPNLVKTKWIITGSICLFVGAILEGINESVVKVTNIKVIQLTTIRWNLQMCIAIFWWILKKPTSPFVFRVDHIIANENDDNNRPLINHWYGDKPHIMNIWGRGFLYGLYGPSFYYAVLRLPLGDFICIHQMSPLLVVFIAHFLLNEKLPRMFVLIPATFLTFVGILFVSQPSFIVGGEPLNTDGVLSAIISTLCYVSITILIRTAVDVHFLQLEIVGSGCCVVIGTILTLFVNHYFLQSQEMGNLNFAEWNLDYKEWLALVFVSFNGFTLISLFVIGYQLGDATLVGWLEYIIIPIDFLFQAFLFNDIPNKYEILGAVAVTIGCLLPAFDQVYIYYVNKEKIDYRMVANQSDIDSAALSEFEVGSDSATESGSV